MAASVVLAVDEFLLEGAEEPGVAAGNLDSVRERRESISAGV